jgi:hypothetical protein
MKITMRLSVRKSVWIAFAATFVFAALVFGAFFGTDTAYAQGYSNSLFKGINLDDSLESVLSKLGPPVEFVIVFDPSLGFRYPKTSEDVSELSKYTSSSSTTLILHFSKPVRAKGNYRAREFWVKAGRVQETRAYTYWD